MKFREKNYAYPLHHLVVKQKVVLKNGVKDQRLVLYIKPSQNNSPIIFKELFSYFSAHMGYSMSWQRHVTRAIGLFYDYCVEKAPAYKSANTVNEVIQGFITSSLSGDEQLGWVPSSVNVVKRHLYHIVRFSEFTGVDTLRPDNVDVGKQYLFRAKQIKENNMLSHASDVKKIAKRLAYTSNDHIYKFSKTPDSRVVEVFPEDLIEPLFKYGFTKKNGHEDLNGKMITALLLFGGMRNSEPFHLWFNDFSIYPSTGKLAIYLHHPSESACNIPPYKKKHRKEYLKERGLVPRNSNEASNSFHAGWKDLALDTYHRTEITFIHKEVERQFVQWWSDYMRLREHCLSVYKANKGADHPFFFVKTVNKDGLGEPYSIASYIKALKRAVKRLSDMGYFVDYGYEFGVSPHPMRHWFITKLSEAGVENKIIQDLANHRNIMSQEVYKGSTKQAIEDALSKISTSLLIDLKGG